MSVRSHRAAMAVANEPAVIRNNLQQLQKISASFATNAVVESVGAGEAPTFESLTPVEQAAGSLGVNPDEWKPISFLNSAHEVSVSLFSLSSLPSLCARASILTLFIPCPLPPPPPP